MEYEQILVKYFVEPNDPKEPDKRLVSKQVLYLFFQSMCQIFWSMNTYFLNIYFETVW